MSTRVICVGDSLTEGYNDLEGGYRAHLVPWLKQAGLDIDFVGGVSGGFTGDNQHEGHPSQAMPYFTSRMDDYYVATPWDAVLMMVGTAQIALQSNIPGMRGELDDLLDATIAQNTSAPIFLARLPGIGAGTYEDYAGDVDVFNAIVDEVVAERQAAGVDIVAVDMNAGFIPDEMTDDGVHPDYYGYMLIASRWAEAVIAHGLGQSPAQRALGDDPIASVDVNDETQPYWIRLEPGYYTFASDVDVAVSRDLSVSGGGIGDVAEEGFLVLAKQPVTRFFVPGARYIDAVAIADEEGRLRIYRESP